MIRRQTGDAARAMEAGRTKTEPGSCWSECMTVVAAGTLALATVAGAQSRPEPPRRDVVVRASVDSAAAAAYDRVRASVDSAAAAAYDRVRASVDSASAAAYDRARAAYGAALNQGDLMRLAGELIAAREVELRLAQSLRDAGRLTRERTDRVRELETQLSAVTRRNAGLASAIRLQCARDDLVPPGYLGVTFETLEPAKPVPGGRAGVYFFGDSAHIVSVDPGSPAQRAGLTVGDQILAIGGYGMDQPVPLGTMLKPGARISVRVLRDGRTRELTVVAGKRADDAGSPCAGLGEILAAGRGVPQAIVAPAADSLLRSGKGTQFADGFRSMIRGRAQPPDSLRAQRPASVLALTPPIGAAAAPPTFFAGAQLVPLDADWRDMTGTDRGLLVAALAPGSPAETSGLRKADVIVAVGDATVATSADLYRLLGETGRSGVVLKVVRARRQVTIVFKPDGRE